ncbi:hypothetical protein DFP73DRAFT_528081 [Morchella snyderi]|nr:hypothetical protein DFP73DRAFT_528081 [Morchella snyderi]
MAKFEYVLMDGPADSVYFGYFSAYPHTSVYPSATTPSAAFQFILQPPKQAKPGTARPKTNQNHGRPERTPTAHTGFPNTRRPQAPSSTPTPTPTPPSCRTRKHTSNGLVDLTHLLTLTPGPLAQFDAELAAHGRTWIADAKHHWPPAEMLRDWLRGCGFFVSLDPNKYRQQNMEEAGSPAGRACERYAGRLLGCAAEGQYFEAACSVLGDGWGAARGGGVVGADIGIRGCGRAGVHGFCMVLLSLGQAEVHVTHKAPVRAVLAAGIESNQLENIWTLFGQVTEDDRINAYMAEITCSVIECRKSNFRTEQRDTLSMHSL